MTNLHQRLAKLEALTEARGATPAEAARARELAAKLRQRLPTESDLEMEFGRLHGYRVTDFYDEGLNAWFEARKKAGRRVVSPAWDPALQGKVFK